MPVQVGTSTGVLKLINHHTDTELLPPLEIKQRCQHASEHWYGSPPLASSLANDNTAYGRPNAILASCPAFCLPPLSQSSMK